MMAVNKISGIALLILSGLFTTAAVAKEPAVSYAGYYLRQEIVKKDGVMLSRPVSVDKTVFDFLYSNGIRSLADYSRWLPGNVKYQPDGDEDLWAGPVEFLKTKKGDCEDFAFLTAAVARVLGYEPRFLALVRDGARHAVCAFEYNGQYVWFDNTELKVTAARTFPEFAQLLTTEYQYYEIQELDEAANTWTTVYAKS